MIAFTKWVAITALIAASAVYVASPPGTPASALILIYGIPSYQIAPYVGGNLMPADFVMVNVDGTWTSGRGLSETLRGKLVDSGNSYRIGVANGSRDPSENMVEGGVDFPLKVTSIDFDPVRLVFNSSGSLHTTYFPADSTQLGGTSIDNRLGVLEFGGLHGGWIGEYVLANGVMVQYQNHWAPQGSRQNGLVMINGEVYNCSVTYVFVPIISGWS